ncbi:unnamed protein product [Dicrocoelium dendriticum]|nr:unnamed protein product [Dicrocoelium dendriticum]
MQFTAMRYNSVTPPELRNDSNSEGARSAKEILLQLDPNFSRAVGILNKYMPGDDSSSYNLDNLNQNKALGTDSELNSLSHGNTTTVSRETKFLGQSDRGGSTFSDLHNTEYLEEYRDNKSKFSPTAKTISSKSTDPGTGQHTPPSRLNPPVRTKSPTSLSDAPASAASSTARTLSQPSRQSGPPAKSAPKRAATLAPKLERKTTPRLESKSEPRSNTKPARVAAAIPGKASKRSTDDFSAQLHQPKTRVSPGKHSKTAEPVVQKTAPKRQQSTPQSMHSRDGDQQQQEEDDDEEESEEYDDEEGEGDERSESETDYTNEFLEPDPSALRDLDNATPKTIALCRRHQCHYCLFVYFPSSTLLEYFILMWDNWQFIDGNHRWDKLCSLHGGNVHGGVT